MYNSGKAVGAASARIDVFAATPTIVSHGGV